jgi:hypothetical protein
VQFVEVSKIRQDPLLNAGYNLEKLAEIRYPDGLLDRPSAIELLVTDRPEGGERFWFPGSIGVLP